MAVLQRDAWAGPVVGRAVALLQEVVPLAARGPAGQRALTATRDAVARRVAEVVGGAL